MISTGHNPSPHDPFDRRTSDDLPSLFRAAPGAFAVLSPDFQLVDASTEYLRQTLLWRNDVRGAPFFQVFPDNPHLPESRGVTNLADSLARAARAGEPDRMPLQRYDVRDFVSANGDWVEKFWLPTNYPVFGAGSREVTHLIHTVEDVTDAVRLHEWINEQDRRHQEDVLTIREQQAALAQRLRDLTRRRRTLDAARARLASALYTGHDPRAAAHQVESQVNAPALSRYFSAGHRVRATAFYQAFHQSPACALRRANVLLREGTRFPRCATCHDAVLYHLLRPWTNA